jgi:hypothetical protein
MFGVSVATQTYIFLNGTPSIFLRFWKALIKTKRKIPHLMGLTSTVSFFFICFVSLEFRQQKVF